MADDEENRSVVERLDLKKHAEMKQALRDKDREDVRHGRATAAEIHKRNLFLGGLDMSKARIVHFGPHSESKESKDHKK